MSVNIEEIVYKKNCPTCHSEIIYNGSHAKYHLNRSIKENWACMKCRAQNRSLPIPLEGWKKCCPVCGMDIFYSSSYHLKDSVKNNTICKKCSVKINNGCFKIGCSIRVGKKLSKQTKKILSEITKSQWKLGIRKPKYKSKGHIEIMDILSRLGYKIQDEYIVEGKPFDIFVEDKKLLIEFNGTYWHRDPRCDKYKTDPMCEIIWKKDKDKTQLALNKGYIIKTIWQSDWETCKNKQTYLINIIENYT